MNDDPRSYRVPVLRLTDVSKNSNLVDGQAQDDSFEFHSTGGVGTVQDPHSSLLGGTMSAGVLKNETGPMATPSMPSPPPRDIEPPTPTTSQPYLQRETPVVPREPISPGAFSAPLPKIPDPFDRPKTLDPLDIWEQASVKKVAPPTPKPSIPTQPVPSLTPPVPAPQIQEEVLHTTPASAYLYGSTVPRSHREQANPPAQNPLSTNALLNEVVQGMGSGEPTTPAPTSVTSVSQPHAVHMNIQAVADSLEEIGIPQTNPAPIPAPSIATPPAPASGNLAALRERVIHSGTAHKDVVTQTPPAGPAEERARALTSVDLHTVREVHEMVAAPPPAPPPIQTPAELLENKHAPETEHAKVIAEVAKALYDIQQSNNETATQSTPAETPAILEHAPTFAQEVAPFTPTPVPTPAGVSTPRHTGIPMIRTFKSDMERAINKDRVSVVKMISDQETRRRSGSDTVVRKTTRRHFTIGTSLVVIGSVILLVGAIALGVFVSVVTLRPSVTDTVNTLFLADQSIEHPVTGQDRTTLLQGLTRIRDSLTTNTGKVTELVPVEEIVVEGVDTKQTRSITGKEFLKRVNARAPDSMARTVQDSFIVGFHMLTKQEPFIVFRVGYPESAFSGMLQWEETMDADLAPLFGTPVSHTPPIQPPILPGTNTASTTASTTDTIEPDPITVDVRDLGVFDDVTIANVSARALRNADGAIQLMWAMPDTSTIIITTNSDTLEEIKTRMQTRQ